MRAVALVICSFVLVGCYRSHGGIDAEGPDDGVSEEGPTAGHGSGIISGMVTVTPVGGPLTIRPGETVALRLEVNNPAGARDPVVNTIIRFGSEGEQVEVPSPSSAEEGLIVNRVRVGSDICDGLCNTVYDLVLLEAVKLASGKVSEPSQRTVQLDCTAHGDPDACPPTGGESRAEQLNNAMNAMFGGLYGCGAQYGVEYPGPPWDEECIIGVFERYESEYGDEFDCIIRILDPVVQCLKAADCNIDRLQACMGSTGSVDSGGSFPLYDECGGFPASLTEELTECFSTFGCSDGETIPLSMQCDGVPDCADGSDEAGCPPTAPYPPALFFCGNGDSIPFEWVCDGEADCADGSDEAGCGW